MCVKSLLIFVAVSWLSVSGFAQRTICETDPATGHITCTTYERQNSDPPLQAAPRIICETDPSTGQISCTGGQRNPVQPRPRTDTRTVCITDAATGQITCSDEQQPVLVPQRPALRSQSPITSYDMSPAVTGTMNRVEPLTFYNFNNG